MDRLQTHLLLNKALHCYGRMSSIIKECFLLLEKHKRRQANNAQLSSEAWHFRDVHSTEWDLEEL